MNPIKIISMMIALQLQSMADTDLYVKESTGKFHKLTDTEAARNLEPERFAPFACAKMVEFNKDWILKEISNGHKVHCEMDSYGPTIHDESESEDSTHGCPYAIFGKLVQKCKDVHVKIPSWAKEK